jgi:ATP-dependent RNA helicase DeaD
MTTTFKELGLSEPILEALTHLGYDKPTPIQEQAIPVLLEGRDVIGQAQTGTGKTAAFGLPLLEYIDPSDDEVQALVLTPTRELCIQVTQALRAYGAKRGINVTAVFGGAPIRTQQAQLKEGAQVVVGTVGRVMDLMSRHSLVLSSTRFVVLDEADEMLDLGFFEDVEKILARCPSGRQTALFSATMPPPIRKLAEKGMFDPETIKVKAATLTIDTVEQFYLEVDPKGKVEAISRVIKEEKPDQALIFVRTKIGTDRLARDLDRGGIRVKALHGDMSQGQRDGVMIAFKGERERIVVATDIAARGLDISGVTHVFNYDPPNSPDVYVHRIGRTGRVGRSGRAITLITSKQREDLKAIERHAKTEIVEWAPGKRTAAAEAVSAKPHLEQKADARRAAAKAQAETKPEADLAPAAAPEAPTAPPTPSRPEPARRGGLLRRRRSEPPKPPEPPTTEEKPEPPQAEPEPPKAAEEPEPPKAEQPAADEPPREKPEPRRPRHTKPRRPIGDAKVKKLVVAAGRKQGIEPADVIAAIVDNSHLDGEDVRNVRVLERFTLLEVPADRADEVVKKVSGSKAGNVTLELEVAAR